MSNRIVYSSIGVTVALLFGYLLSFLKESVIAYFYGVSADTDAYTIAIQIPVTLFAFVAVAINSVVIPLYSKIIYQQGKDVANAFVNKLLSLLVIGLLAFVLLGEVLASPIVYLFAPGFSSETHILATKLLRIVFPSVLFSVYAHVVLAVLNVHKMFVAPAFAVYFLNLGIIGGILLLHQQFGIASACIGQLIGGGMQIAFLMFLARNIYGFRPTIRFLNDDNITKAVKQTGPIIWSISVAEVNALVNRMVASLLFVGSVAALGYAQKVNSVSMTLFTHVISTIIYPFYAESSAKNNDEQLARRVNLTLSLYTMVLMPLTIGVLCLREELIQLAFGRGQFDAAAVDTTQQLLGFYCLGILFLGFRETLTKVFYSLSDTKTPAVNATIGVILNIVLNVSLPFIMGVNGLALATSICAVVISSRLLVQLLKTGKVKFDYFFPNLRKTILATAVMALVIFAERFFMLGMHYLLRMIIVTVTGITVYFVTVVVIKLPILQQVNGLLGKKKK